jgi:hypothetical protein
LYLIQLGGTNTAHALANVLVREQHDSVDKLNGNFLPGAANAHFSLNQKGIILRVEVGRFFYD